jgi:hypothetical protein
MRMSTHPGRCKEDDERSGAKTMMSAAAQK